MDRVSRSELDFSASGEYKIREAWVSNFSFSTHASFYVPRWAIGLALNIKLQESGAWQKLCWTEITVSLSLTSILSGLMYKESSRRRLKLDGVTWPLHEVLGGQVGTDSGLATIIGETYGHYTMVTQR